MAAGGLLPRGESLRNAVRWLAAQPRRDRRVIEEACRRYDLGPADEEFLLREYLRRPRR